MAFDDALRLLRKIKPYSIDAAEQLLGIWDIAGMAELARRVDIPMIADECVSTDRKGVGPAQPVDSKPRKGVGPAQPVDSAI